jgi:DNA uptake protein ComE-like DNA-binding protein
MRNMTGITISEMAEKLGIEKNAVLQRLFVAKIKPKTREALYDESALEAIRDVQGKGRPKKEAAPEPAKPRAKKSVTTKKLVTPEKGESGKRRGTP